MEGFGKYRKVSSAHNRKCLNTPNLGLISIMSMIALLLHFVPLTHSLGHFIDSSPKPVVSPSVADLPADDEGYAAYPMKYDEYPIVVPKRAALIFDRILKGLQSASENNPFVNDWSPVTRRGNSKDKLYFRCYFNAVSCYKKK